MPGPWPSGVCVPGYIVFSGPRRANGIQGLRFIIQSEKPPHYLESRVEAFLITMEKSIEDMTEEAFQKHIQALAIRRLDKPKKLSAECAKYWGEIISQQYNFDRGKAVFRPQCLWLVSVAFEDPKAVLQDGARSIGDVPVLTWEGGGSSTSKEPSCHLTISYEKLCPFFFSKMNWVDLYLIIMYY